jgi:hypothetical protein
MVDIGSEYGVNYPMSSRCVMSKLRVQKKSDKNEDPH